MIARGGRSLPWTRLGAVVAGGVVALVLSPGSPAHADKCTGAKLKAVGKKEGGLLGCSAKEATTSGVAPACEMGVSGKFMTAYNKPTGCMPAAPPASQCETIADSCQSSVRMALPAGNGTSTGKLKGIKGHGTYKGTPNADGTVTYQVSGEYSLP